MKAYNLRFILQDKMKGTWAPDEPVKFKHLIQLLQYAIQEEQNYEDIVEEWQNTFLNRKDELEKLLSNFIINYKKQKTMSKKVMSAEDLLLNLKNYFASLDEEDEDEAPVKKKKKPAVEEEDEEDENEDGDGDEEDDAVDMEAVTKAAKKLVAAGKSAKLKPLLSKYKAAKVSDLKKTQLEKFMAEMKKIK